MRKIGTITVDPNNPPILFNIPNIDIDLANEFLKNEVGNNQNEIDIVFASSKQPARVQFYKLVQELLKAAKKRPLFNEDQMESFEKLRSDCNTRHLLLLASCPKVETGFFNPKTNIVTIFLDDFFFISYCESDLNLLLSSILKHELSHSARSFYEHIFRNVFYLLKSLRHLLFYVSICFFLWLLTVYSQNILIGYLSAFLSIFFIYKIKTWELSFEDYINDPEEIQARKSASTGPIILKIDKNDLETTGLMNDLFPRFELQLNSIKDA